MEDFILFFPKIALQFVFQMVKNIQFFGNQRCSLDSATVSIIVVVELTKTQSKAKIQITDSETTALAFMDLHFQWLSS